MSKIPYIIMTPGYATRSAGVRALHRLCHILNTGGYEAYLYTILNDQSNPDWNTPVITDQTEKVYKLIHEAGAIVLYPEVFGANLLSSFRPVGFVGSPYRESPFPIKFYYEKFCGFAIPDDKLLTIDVIERELFNDDNITEPRDINTVWVGKGNGDDLDKLNIPNKVVITNAEPATRKELAKLLRKSNLFYTFDNITALMSEARLCGCPCVFIPNKYQNEQFNKGTTVIPYGVAINNTPEEIEKARQTLHLFKQEHINRYSKENEYVQNFIKITQSM